MATAPTPSVLDAAQNGQRGRKPALDRTASVLLVVAALFGTILTPVAAGEVGGHTGDVTVRMTLNGPIDDRDGFLVVIACGDDWCNDTLVDPTMPDGKIVIFCGPQVADAPVCAAQTYEFTVELQTGQMDFWFFRIPDWETDSQGLLLRHQMLHHGTSDIHSRSQTISMEYVYPDGGSSLPDTAMPKS